MLLLLAVLLLEVGQLARAQCPWARDSIDLHSDCICDFNPQPISSQQAQQKQTHQNQTTALNNQQQHVTRRMSVQCAPVDFEQLLRALKQTASIELPLALARRSSLVVSVNHSNGVNLSEHQADEVDTDDLEEDKTRFISQAKLDLLHVSNSSIDALENNTFVMDTRQKIAGIPSRHLVVAIQSLHLSRCSISRIESGAFNGLEWSLTSLSLNDNQLEWVPRQALERLTNLKLLDLSNNKIKKITSGTFLKLTKLHTLRLADNRQIGQRRSDGGLHEESKQAIELGAFEGLEANLNDLSLKNTQLGEFPQAISRLANLAFLNLAQNQIGQVPPRMFAQMNSLTAINLERNRISSIENDTFAGVESTLSSLSLLGNLIEAFPVRQLENLGALRRLDMGFNRIETLPLDSFTTNKRLILIALDGNPLKTLPELAFKPLEGTLRGLSVGGKSLDCDCRLSWMLRWQIELGLQISSRERTPQFCAKPAYLRSLVSFAALKPEHLLCSAQHQFGSSSPVAYSATTTASQLPQTTLLMQQSSNMGGWTASTGNLNQDASSTYFTSATETQAATSNATITTSLPTTRLEPSDTSTSLATPTTSQKKAERDREEQATNQTTGASAVTLEYVETTTARPPGSTSGETTTKSGPETTATAFSSSSIHTIGAISRTPSITAATSIGLNEELAEAAGTSDESMTSEASTTISSDSIGNNQLTLGSLPDDELFAASPHEPSRRRISHRHGHLASNDLLRFNKSTSEPHQSSQSPTVVSRAALEFPPVPNGDPVSSITTPSVFGDRQIASSTSSTRKLQYSPPPQASNEPDLRRELSRSATSNPPSRQSFILPGQRNQQVPAIPTTVNVYKTPTQSPPLQQQQQQQQAKRRPQLRYESSLLKGARFVEETTTQTLMPQTTIATTPTRATAQPTSQQTSPPTSNPTMRKRFTTRRPPEVDFDSERFSQPAASSILAQVSTFVTPLTSVLNTTTPLPSTTTIKSTTSAPVTLNSIGQQHTNQFNTRMSVSSMYRMATSSLRSTSSSASTTTTTTPAPPWSSGLVQDTGDGGPSHTDRTTRMAATVRIVDSLPRQVHLVPVASSTTSTITPKPISSSTTTTTTTPLPTTTAAAAVATTTTTPRTPPVVQTRTATVKHNDDQVQDTRSSSSSTTNNLINQAGQDSMNHSGGESEHRTTIPTAFDESQSSGHDSTAKNRLTESTDLTTGGSSNDSIVQSATSPRATRHPANVQTKEGILPASVGAPSLTDQLLDSSTRMFARKFSRLADVDQVALILAGVMCICLFLIALIVIACTCCLSQRTSRKSAAQSSGLVRQSQSSSPTNSLAAPPGQARSRNHLLKFLCCCLSSRGQLQTPIQTLMLQDDGNSTSSSSGGGSSSNLVNGGAASINQALFQHQRNQMSRHSSRPGSPNLQKQYLKKANTLGQQRKPGLPGLGLLDHEAPVKIHKRAHAFDKEYFLAGARTHGRRKSRWSSELDLTNQESHYFGLKRGGRLDLAADWMSDSGDSDKSCSPGANKNNRYNMSDAHRAYLAGKQIQASMFVTTASNQQAQEHPASAAANRRTVRRMGLLKTIDVGLIASQPHSDHCLAGASDRSITDDSRAPLDNSAGARQCDMMLTDGCYSPEPIEAAQINRTVSTSNAAAKCVSTVGRPQQVGQHHSSSFGQLVVLQGVGSRRQHGDFMMPTGGDEWPEPYLEPLSATDQEFHEYQAAAAAALANERAQSRPVAQFNSFDNNQCQDRRFEHFIQEPQMISGEDAQANTKSYDEAYLANWRTISRSGNGGESRNQMSSQTQSHRPGGGANWLRWTPTRE